VVCQQPLKQVLLVKVISSSIPVEVMTKQLGRKERGSLTPLWICRECHSGIHLCNFCINAISVEQKLIKPVAVIQDLISCQCLALLWFE